MPYALHTITAPGSLVAGYQRGHELHPSVIEAWGLVEGSDWSADVPDAMPESGVVVPRPVDDSDRGAWVAYAVAQGMDPDEAASTDLPALMERYGHDERADDEYPRPADSAKKADWVAYISEHPQATADDKTWATDDSTTKADLQAWEPAPSDPAAVAATEANQG